MEPFSQGDLGALTKQESRAVGVVAERGPLRMGDLAEALGVVQSAVTPLVDRLEAAGLVARERGATDRRVWLVGVTDAGRGVAASVDGAYRALAAGLLAPLSPADRADLERILGLVVEAMTPGEDA